MTHTFAQTYFPCVTMLNVVVFENHLWTVYSISQKNTCRTVCVYVFDKWYFYNFDLTIGTTFLQNNKSFFGSKTGDRSKLHTPKTSLIIQNRNNQQKKKKTSQQIVQVKTLETTRPTVNRLLRDTYNYCPREKCRYLPMYVGSLIFFRHCVSHVLITLIELSVILNLLQSNASSLVGGNPPASPKTKLECWQKIDIFNWQKKIKKIAHDKNSIATLLYGVLIFIYYTLISEI